jgi:hypothetical protein
MAPLNDTTRASQYGALITLAVIIGGLILFLSWLFRFPWDFGGL